MNAFDARELLAATVQQTIEPVLTDTELDLALALMATVDSAGLAPKDVGYVPTYSASRLPVAAARCWQMKAGKCVNKVFFMADGSSFSAGQMFDHCMQMAELARKEIIGSIGARSALTP